METYQGVVPSGMIKRPVSGPVVVRTLNLDGDGQADLSVHGGPDKAVYVMPVEHYPLWRAELGRDDLAPGWFGENLTIEGLGEDEARVGDVLRVGTAAFQVTQARIPCFKLAARMGDPGFARTFLRSGRTGWYVRVLREGVLAAGDPVEREDRPGSLSVREVAALVGGGASADALERAAALEGLSARWRDDFTRRAAERRRRESQPPAGPTASSTISSAESERRTRSRSPRPM
jgi:MOSC domain-containing protein YiiM